MSDEVIPRSIPPASHFFPEQWIESASNEASDRLYQQCVAALTRSPNRADILIRVDNLPVETQPVLIEKLLTHSKVGTLSIYGMPRSARIHIAAQAVLLGVHVRFVESEDEMNIILAKRRAVFIATSIPDVHPGLLNPSSVDHLRRAIH